MSEKHSFTEEEMKFSSPDLESLREKAEGFFAHYDEIDGCIRTDFEQVEHWLLVKKFRIPLSVALGEEDFMRLRWSNGQTSSTWTFWVDPQTEGDDPYMLLDASFPVMRRAHAKLPDLMGKVVNQLRKLAD